MVQPLLFIRRNGVVEVEPVKRGRKGILLFHPKDGVIDSLFHGNVSPFSAIGTNAPLHRSKRPHSSDVMDGGLYGPVRAPRNIPLQFPHLFIIQTSKERRRMEHPTALWCLRPLFFPVLIDGITGKVDPVIPEHAGSALVQLNMVEQAVDRDQILVVFKLVDVILHIVDHGLAVVKCHAEAIIGQRFDFLDTWYHMRYTID